MRKLISILIAMTLVGGCSQPVEESDLYGNYRGIGFANDVKIMVRSDGSLILMEQGSEDILFKWRALTVGDADCLPLEITSFKIDILSRKVIQLAEYNSSPCAKRTITGDVRIIFNADMNIYLDKDS